MLIFWGKFIQVGVIFITLRYSTFLGSNLIPVHRRLPGPEAACRALITLPNLQCPMSFPPEVLLETELLMPIIAEELAHSRYLQSLQKQYEIAKGAVAAVLFDEKTTEELPRNVSSQEIDKERQTSAWKSDVHVGPSLQFKTVVGFTYAIMAGIILLQLGIFDCKKKQQKYLRCLKDMGCLECLEYYNEFGWDTLYGCLFFRYRILTWVFALIYLGDNSLAYQMAITSRDNILSTKVPLQISTQKHRLFGLVEGYNVCCKKIPYPVVNEVKLNTTLTGN